MNSLEKRTIAAALAFTIVAVFFFFSIFLLHPFGDPGEVQMDDRIIVNTQNESVQASGTATSAQRNQ